jgi:hypothetical protein
MRGGDLVERYDGVDPDRQVAAGCRVEKPGETGTVGMRHHHADGDAALLARHRARLHADEEPAVTDQRREFTPDPSRSRKAAVAPIVNNHAEHSV